MAKRGPQSSLNHLNWNETDEPEEKGEFAKASDDILKHRVIKKARRRVATDAADSTAPAASTSVFGAFKGFASTPVAKNVDKPDGAPTFSFLSSLGAGAAKTNGNGTATVSSSGSDSNAAGSTKPMFSFGSNLGTIAASDANKKMFTFGTANALKADSTEGAKNASSTSSGFGISSSKDGEKDAGKGLFSFTNTSANAGTMPTFSFGSVPPKATDSPKPEKNFTFGSPIGNKNAESDTTAKSTFSFGSIAAKTGSGEADKKMPTFGSPIAAKDSSLNAASSTGMFNFGSNAAKSDTGGDSEKKTFTFGSSPAAAKETINSLGKGTFSFGSVAPKSDTSETEKKAFAFGGSPAATKEPADAAPTKSMFSFGSNAAKPTAPIEIPKRATVTFGSPAGIRDTSGTSLASPKGTFSFGSIPPKSNADEGAVKKPYSFGYVSTGAKDTAVTSPKGFSFGIPQPTNSNLAGTPTKPTESEKKSYSFGVTSPSNETAADKSKETATFATPKENSDDTIKKMFSFASSTATPKAGQDTGKKDEEKRTVSAPFATTTKPAASVTPQPAVTGVEKTLCVRSNVIALNKAFIAWITEKTKENAYCSLLPVFKSYETYFEEITKTEQSCTAETKTTTVAEAAKPSFATSKPDNATTANTSEQTNALANKPTTDQVPKEPEKPKEKTGFFFGTSAAKESPTTVQPVVPAAAATPASTGFMFGGTAKPLTFGAFSTAGNTTNITATTNNLSSVSTTSPSFFAGASTFASKALSPGGFTFGSVVKPPVPDSSAANDKDSAGGGDGGEADEDEPPKVEFTPVEEKDSLYSKRCKLFVKAGGSYSDRGVGTLHVKMVDGKVQVLVRADTSLGNILLNIILNDSVPLQRLGKNNVMMICLPTPDAKPPPTSVLLRVKTTEEADELYESLLKYKPK
ncbi:nuclear pore complex protein Nup50 [Anopheles moucheti]|uniref:nuclear pore complex protein Nup50 n=1 Tax=Anopheles moucheti TaxID=186751 RepID=UPI0022F08B0F|nr:nuclear pore complex protein Nup50 [Anopheles moucheti]